MRRRRVSRRVSLEHRPPRLPCILREVPEVDVAHGRRERARVLRDRDDVVVLRDRPEAAGLPFPRVPVHRVVLAQQREAIVRDPVRVGLVARDVDSRELGGRRHLPSVVVGAAARRASQSALVDSTWRTIASRAALALPAAIARTIACSASASSTTAGPCRASRSGTRPRGSRPPGRRAARAGGVGNCEVEGLSRSLQGSNSSIDSISSTSEPRYSSCSASPAGGKRCRAALDDDAVVDEVAQVGFGRDGGAHGEPAGAGAHRRAAAAAALRLEEPRPSQDRDRAAQRHRRDTEVVGEPPLGRQPVAGPQPHRSHGRAARPSRRRRCRRGRACRPSARRGAERRRRAGS